jgi:hypothetical protein
LNLGAEGVNNPGRDLCGDLLGGFASAKRNHETRGVDAGGEVAVPFDG